MPLRSAFVPRTLPPTPYVTPWPADVARPQITLQAATHPTVVLDALADGLVDAGYRLTSRGPRQLTARRPGWRAAFTGSPARRHRVVAHAHDNGAVLTVTGEAATARRPATTAVNAAIGILVARGILTIATPWEPGPVPPRP